MTEPRRTINFDDSLQEQFSADPSKAFGMVRRKVGANEEGVKKGWKIAQARYHPDKIESPEAKRSKASNAAKTYCLKEVARYEHIQMSTCIQMSTYR